MTEPLAEIALNDAEVAEVLRHCGPAALLVGGQALAFWATRYEVEPVGVLAAAITSDADFIGSAQVAASLGRSLGWQHWVPSLDDATTQTAKLTKTVPGIGIKQIDFLSGIVGLETDRVERRAVTVTLPDGAMIRVLHPLDVLESRLRNLLSLPSKRNAAGVAQARLAIAVARRFLTMLAEPGSEQRTVLDAVERIAQVAMDKRLLQVFADYDLDPLAAVPVTLIAGEEFQSRRWPQIVKAVAAGTRRARPGRRLEGAQGGSADS